LKTKLVVAALLLGANLGAVESLAVHLDGDYLRVSLPQVDFLKGKPLDRLKDGASIAFVGKISVTLAPNSLITVAQSVTSFALSYDIWEERFSVTKIDPTGSRRIQGAHLSAQAAENLCLDSLAIDRGQLPADKPFYVQLDLRMDDGRDQLGIIGDPGINFTRLIELLGRQRSPQEHWLYNSGPLRLADLKKTEVRAVRG
jgi:hypothetical protein